MKKLVVTRHQGLVDYLKNEGIIKGDEKIVSHASPEDIRGNIVIGVLPLSLAVLAAEVWEVPLNLPAELRGVELSEAQVRQFAGNLVKYQVKAVI